MFRSKKMRLALLGISLTVGLLCVPIMCEAQLRDRSKKRFKEPVFRTAKVEQQDKKKQPNKKKQPGHVLDSAIKVAQDGLNHLHKDIRDFTAILYKKERINGKLTAREKIFVKVRHQQIHNGKVVTPFSVYLKFIEPDDGREVIFVEGRNEGKLIAHQDGLLKFKWFYLDPNGLLAMRGNRYPISEIGIEILTKRLLEKATRDRAHGECKVDFYKGAGINGRRCTMIEVTHPFKRRHFDFHIARIYIDDELQIPIRYAAFSWPVKKGGDPVLEEEYTYTNVKLNVGLNNADFDPNNPKYDYP